MQEILSYYEILRVEFPGAEIRGSTFEAYMQALSAFKASLPVVTKEIADTWIQGVSSDPRKQAEFRAVRRAFSQCLASGSSAYCTNCVQQSMISGCNFRQVSDKRPSGLQSRAILSEDSRAHDGFGQRARHDQLEQRGVQPRQARCD